MVRPSLTLALLLPLVLLLSPSARSETVADCLDWPPVFERTWGNPGVMVKEAPQDCPKVVFIRPARLVIVKTPDCASKSVSFLLRKYFLGLAWSTYLDERALSEVETRLNMGELIPMSRSTFFKVGHCRLAGRQTGDCVQDAWWNVRTGVSLTESCDHLLAITNLEWDDPDKYSHGHFAFALRKRRGSPSKDTIYDFRAPWYEDRRPRFTEAPNIHNVLKLRGLQENLYDWLYTQTEYRNSHVTMSFTRIHKEQIALLRAYKGNVHDAGNFRVFKKNCASLGTQFLNRLLPLDEEIRGEDSFADLPTRAHKASVDAFGGAVEAVEIKNHTLEAGNDPTSKSELHAAQPSRAASRPYRKLMEVAEIN